MTRSLNVIKSFKDSLGKHSFMARSLIGIRRFYDSPGEVVDDWFDLGRNEWYDDEGTVRSPVLALGSHPRAQNFSEKRSLTLKVKS